jgi:hypothetical protein
LPTMTCVVWCLVLGPAMSEAILSGLFMGQPNIRFW